MDNGTDHLGPIATDRLEGLREIAAYLYGRFDTKTRARTDYLIRTGRLPVGREGQRIVASKRVLTE